MAGNCGLSPLASVEEVDKEWIGKILSNKLNLIVQVESMEKVLPEGKAGFLSEICFTKVTYSSSNTTEDVAVVVKVLPQHKEIVAFMKLGKLGEREVMFYKRAGLDEFLKFCHNSGLEHPVPEVYWSCSQEDSLTLVLDDLNAKGYKMFLLPDGNDLQQIKCTFEAIAIIHAYGIAAINKHGKEYFEIEFDSGYLEDIVKQGLQMQIEMAAGNTFAETLKALLPLVKQMIATSRSHPLVETLVHGDLWAGNVMFKANAQAASIFDWQFMCIDNPLCDITSMLLMSAEPMIYGDHLEEVLEIYWKSFTNALTKNDVDIPITYEDLVKNLDKLWMHGFMFFTASLPDMMGNNKITKARVINVQNFLEKLGTLSAFINSCS